MKGYGGIAAPLNRMLKKEDLYGLKKPGLRLKSLSRNSFHLQCCACQIFTLECDASKKGIDDASKKGIDAVLL